MMCWLCGTTDEYDFKKYHHKFICDDCMSVLNYHFGEMFKDIESIWHEKNPEYEQFDFYENSFLEALEEYVSYRQDKYNEELRKERMNQWQK